MLKIYGSRICPDCVACEKDLTEAGVAYEFLDFCSAMQNLKDFLKIRDGNPLFDEFRTEGKVGIPCILKENGEILFDWSSLI